MKIELAKETKWNGEVYFYISEDGSRVSGSTIYGGTVNNPAEIQKAQEQAENNLQRYLDSQNNIEIIKTIEK